MVNQKWKRIWADFKTNVRDFTHVLSGGGLALGLLLFVLGVLSLYYEKMFPDIHDALTETQSWDICFAGLGFILVIFAGYYFADNMFKRHKFRKLFRIASKEKFLKNRDDIEHLAWEISTKHERMVQRKIKQMKLK